MLLPAIELEDGRKIAVQPIPVMVVVPGRRRIALVKGVDPKEQMLADLMQGRRLGKATPPAFVPHNVVCLGHAEDEPDPDLLVGLVPMDAREYAGEGTPEEPEKNDA
jgi:hypothetical protein